MFIKQNYQLMLLFFFRCVSYGFLRDNSKKTFALVPPVESGFILKGAVKDMSLIRLTKGEKLILAEENNDSLRIFQDLKNLISNYDSFPTI